MQQRLIVQPRLTGNGWYLFGDPATALVLEYAYLSSAQGPQLSSRDGGEVLGRELAARVATRLALVFSDDPAP